MCAKQRESDRRRSRPVQKKSKVKAIKRNKSAMFLAIFIVLMLVFSAFYVIFSSFKESDNSDNASNSYQNDPEYLAALSNTNYPVAVIETTKGVMAIELYNNKMPITCNNFINLVEDGFYDGMIFHRISDDFMIQAGNTYPDGSTKESPYGNIAFEESDINHVDGAISMASTAAGVGGSAQFFICDGEQAFLDGNYAAFGKLIYGWDTLRDIADEPQDNSSPAGGGKPLNDIIINRMYIAQE
jgi:cyclophilin family peptidyl-prolyl cis-trans isomerase